jgi:hypothetical protein
MQENLILRVNDKGHDSAGNGLEAHPLIKKGTVVTWQHSEPFYVTLAEPNPCTPSPTWYSNVYSAVLASGPEERPRYEVSCEIARPGKASPIQYGLTAGYAPTPPPSDPIREFRTTPCGGCGFGVDPTPGDC